MWVVHTKNVGVLYMCHREVAKKCALLVVLKLPLLAA